MRKLWNRIELFTKVTSEFVEESEAVLNFSKYLVSLIRCLPPRANGEEAKAWIAQMIDRWVSDKIIDAETFIIEYTIKTIKDGETIMVYGYSDLLRNMIIALNSKLKVQRVYQNVQIIYASEVDNKFSREFVSTLTSRGVQITYTTINGVPYFLNRVSKIFMVGITMYSNGSLLGIAGTALMAAYGANFRKPCYVLCESFKFSEKSKIDGLIANKGVSRVVAEDPSSSNRIALEYDLTPGKYISLVVSEIGIIPPSSVSVVIREFYNYDTQGIVFQRPNM